MFVNRKRELSFLEKQYERKNSSFVILHGRRRIGKTELVKHFIQDKPNTYYLAEQKGPRTALQEITEQLSHHLPILSSVSIRTWVELGKVLATQYEGDKLVLCIDEFPYLFQGREAFLATVQKMWDEHLQHMNIMLILTGSSISVMEDKVLSASSPLYGRRTGQWNLTPFNLAGLHELHQTDNIQKLIECYACVGGSPFYNSFFNIDKSIEQNIAETIFTKGSILYEEPEYLLRQELRRPQRYIAILQHISQGKNTFNELSQHTGIQKSSLSRYISQLQRLHFISSIKPVTASENTKNYRYTIDDPFIEFWFRYVFPSKNRIELGHTDTVVSKTLETFDAYVGRQFETIVEQFMYNEFPITTCGPWWWKEHEIDRVAMSNDTVYFCEAKWHSKPVTKRVVTRLKKHAKYVRVKKEKKRYCVFSKSGFSFKPEDDTLLFSLNDMKRLF